MKKHIHHAIPRSRGGTDESWNLVELDPYTHAYEHALDFVLFDHAPMFDFRQQGWKLLPEDLQEVVRTTHSLRMKGSSNPSSGGLRDDTKQKMSKVRKGVLKTEDHKRKIKESNLKHTPVKCPHCDKVGREAQMKRWHFNNCPHLTGVAVSQPRAICPHCGLSGSSCNMKRYHFDNCKLK